MFLFPQSHPAQATAANTYNAGVLPHGGEELERDHPKHEGCGEHAQRHNQLKYIWRYRQ
jgi:hypothetical protein